MIITWFFILLTVSLSGLGAGIGLVVRRVSEIKHSKNTFAVISGITFTISTPISFLILEQLVSSLLPSGVGSGRLVTILILSTLLALFFTIFTLFFVVPITELRYKKK
jgi:hypothetical protein